MTGSLYLLPVALGDIVWPNYLPPATRDIACGLSCFIAENAKTARGELKRLGHPLPLREVTIAQLPSALNATDPDRLLQPLLDGMDVGLMSEAGCPAVADPGATLVRRAHELGIAVKPLVGPSSLLLALMASGLDGQRFTFHGYLPAHEPARGMRIVELENESARQRQTQIFIETPYRNLVLFNALLAAGRPSSRLCLATDLTLTTEAIATHSLADWRNLPPPPIDKRPTVFLLLTEPAATRRPR